MEEQNKIILGLKVLCKDIFEFGYLIPQTYWQKLRSNRLLLNLAVESKAHPSAIQFHDRPLKRTPQSGWPTSQQQTSRSTLWQTSKTYKSFKLDCKAQAFFFTFKGKPSANWLCNKASSLVSRLFQTCPSVRPFDVTICHMTSSALLCVWVPWGSTYSATIPNYICTLGYIQSVSLNFMVQILFERDTGRKTWRQNCVLWCAVHTINSLQAPRVTCGSHWVFVCCCFNEDTLGTKFSGVGDLCCTFWLIQPIWAWFFPFIKHPLEQTVL